jgi:uncharacterized protein (DUF2267 family)
MDELIKEIVAKTGMPEQAARTATETVVRFLKEKLPAPIAGQIDGLLDNPDLANQAGNALKGLGGLLGRK